MQPFVAPLRPTRVLREHHHAAPLDIFPLCHHLFTLPSPVPHFFPFPPTPFHFSFCTTLRLSPSHVCKKGPLRSKSALPPAQLLRLTLPQPTAWVCFLARSLSRCGMFFVLHATTTQTSNRNEKGPIRALPLRRCWSKANWVMVRWCGQTRRYFQIQTRTV